MSPPSIAQAPNTVLVAIEDSDLAVDGAGRTAIAVAIEGNGLHQILVAVLMDGLETGAVVGRRRVC